MRLKELTEGGVDVFALEGEIDLHSSPSLRAVLHGKTVAGCPALILDLSGVTYIDSSGLAAIMEYMRDAANRSAVFCIAGANEDLTAIFAIVRLDGVLPKFSSRAEAVAAIKMNRVQPPAGVFNRSASAA